MNQTLAVGGVLVGRDRFWRGGLSLRDGRIHDLEGPTAGAARLLAIPGLRNAHVHLDLSDIADVPRATRGFARWVLDLIARRGGLDPARRQRAAALGAAESLSTGTTSVGDIDSSGAAAATVAAAGLKGISFREVLGGVAVEEAAAWGKSFERFAPGGRLQAGVSPHAPYSTSPAQYVETSELAVRGGLGWTTHLSETAAELEFVTHGTGELREMLETLGAPLPFDEIPGRSPVAYLDELGCLHERALLAHVNHADEDDVRRLARSGAAVVYCPRSHNFFGHPAHPITRLRAAGVPVALGTDSRASNGSLSMFAEMAFLRAARPDLAAADVFEMTTAAAAGRLDGGSGRLEPGAEADLVVVECSSGGPESLEEALHAVTTGAVRVVATLVSGDACYVRADAVAGWPALTPKSGGLLSSES